MIDKEIKGIECRFAVHIPAKPNIGSPDLHFVKENVHYTDGTTEPRVRFLKDEQRPFWVTRKPFRDHQQKKEWELLEKVDEIYCTQSELRDKVAQALDKGWSNENIKKLSNSPYLYGTDLTSSAFIKLKYQDKYPGLMSPYTVSIYDTETDVVFGTGQIIISTITLKQADTILVYTYVHKDFVKNISSVQERVDRAMEKYLLPRTAHKISGELFICEDEFDVVKQTLAQLHKWKPDFLEIWNIDFDIPKTVQACEKVGVDPKDIFCDPIIPKQLRFFKYLQGKKKKVTASGKEIPINPADQWHSVSCPCSFFIIDGMSSYRQIRLAKQAEPSYSLDAILKREKISDGKLSFEEADQYIGLRWHQVMQDLHKIEYIVYNRYDCIGVSDLEEKIKDLSFTVPAFAGITDFGKFNSQTRKIADAFFIFLRENGYVPGTVGQTTEKVEEEEESNDDDLTQEEIDAADFALKNDDAKVLSLRDWIITLPAHLTTVSGIRCISEDPSMRTNMRGYVSDSDAVSSYPSDISAANISKETTFREVVDIDGIAEEVFRMQNINLLSGSTNSLEYCQTMFNFPTLHGLLDIYTAQR